MVLGICKTIKFVNKKGRNAFFCRIRKGETMFSPVPVFGFKSNYLVIDTKCTLGRLRGIAPTNYKCPIDNLNLIRLDSRGLVRYNIIIK